MYRVQIGFNNDDLWANTTKSVAKVYDIPANVETIKYSYDGTKENEKDWTVLYKDETAKTVEILSPEAMGSLDLGVKDTEVQGSNDWEKAVYSYNHAIERLNNYASSLITNPNKISVRSVGSNPSNSNYRNTTKYTSDKLESWSCSLKGTPVTVNGVAEVGENNYEQDLVRMSALGVASIENNYWLASRCGAVSTSNTVYFSVACVDGGVATESSLFYAYSEGYVDFNTGERAIRPIVKINY